MADTVEFYDRNDRRMSEQAVIKLVQHDVAQVGYRVDRIRDVVSHRHGVFWRYLIPVLQVIR